MIQVDTFDPLLKDESENLLFPMIIADGLGKLAPTKLLTAEAALDFCYKKGEDL